VKLKYSAEVIEESLENELKEKEREIAVLKEELKRIREKLRKDIIPIEGYAEEKGDGHF